MNKKSFLRCKYYSLHQNKLFISLMSSIIFLIISTMSVSAQNQLVKGTVTDEKTNMALIGVSVKVDGTTNGSITDFNGNFSLNVPTPNAVLEFSYIGYISQKVNVNGQSEIKVILAEDTRNLDEVIVVGYGVQKKSLVTGAISGVKTE